MTDASAEAPAEEPAPTLLTAVLVLAVTEFNAEGHWIPIDTAIGAVVSVILVAYTHAVLRTVPWPKAIAIALSYATSFTITLTYFVQFGVRHWYHPTGADQVAVNTKVGDASRLFVSPRRAACGDPAATMAVDHNVCRAQTTGS